MNNKKQSVMSNQQSLIMYLTEQIGIKTKSLGSSEFNDIEISIPTHPIKINKVFVG
jgi:hypothetical protein